MKMLVAGNLVNHGYFLTKLLRENNISAELLFRKKPEISEDPLEFDPDLKEYPNWIKMWDGSNKNWKWNVINIMRKYDLIQASTELPIFSMFSRKPYIVFATGSDIIELAHQNNLKGFLLRRAYKKAKLIIVPGLYMYPSVKKLKLKKTIFLPLLWDYNKYKLENYSTKSNDEFTIFHPTRHDWQVKGNDKFLKAFTRFAKDRTNVKLITINHGKDFKRSINILKNRNIKEKVKIIPNRLGQNEMLQYYHQSNVIVDYFNLGSTGMIGQEAMACEKPLIQYVNNSLYEEFYKEIPPIENANSEDEVYQSLCKLYDDPKLCKKIGKDSRKWILKHHNPQRIIKKYIYLYDSILNKVKFEIIKEKINSI